MSGIESVAYNVFTRALLNRHVTDANSATPAIALVLVYKTIRMCTMATFI